MATFDSSIISKLLQSKIKQVVLCAKCNKFPLYTLDSANPEKVNEYCPICKNSRSLTIKELSEEMLLRDREPEHECQVPDHAGTKAEKFCSTCERWLCQRCSVIHLNEKHDLLTTSIVSEKCLEHQQKYEQYCPECKLNLCKECADKHEIHKNKLKSLEGLLDLKNILSYLNHRKSIKKHTQQVRLIYNKIMEELDNYKNNISEAYTKANKINIQILELYDIFLGLAGIFKQNYNVFHNIKDFCMFSFKTFKYDNVEQIKFESFTVKELKEFNNYLDKSYIIVQTSNNEFEGLQKIVSLECDKFVSCTSYYEKEGIKFIVIGFNDGSISLMDITDPTKKLFKIKDLETHKHKGPILCLLVDDDYIYSGSVDCCIKKWKINKKVKTYELIFQGSFTGHSNDINKIIKSPFKENQIISCSSDESVFFWDINFQPNQEEKSKEKNIVFEESVISIAHIPNTNYLVIATADDNLCLYDNDAEKIQFTLENIVCSYPGCLKARKNEIIVGGGNSIKLLKLEEQKLKEETTINFEDDKYKSLEFTQDLINIILEGDYDILFTNSKNRIYKYSFKNEKMQSKEITYDVKIEGFSPIGKNKYAVVFGKKLEIMST